jgi:hypothetical protein
MLVLVFLLADSAHTVAYLLGLFLVLLGFQLLAFFPTVIGFPAITASLRLQRPHAVTVSLLLQWPLFYRVLAVSVPLLLVSLLLKHSCCYSTVPYY